MFDFVPLEYYTSLHYQIILLIILFVLISSYVYNLDDQLNVNGISTVGIVFLILLTFYMGMRPISGYYFGDTFNYAAIYSKLQKGGTIIITKDYLFNYMILYCSKIMDVHSFYLIVDILYLTPCILFSKKYFGRYWFFGMLMFISSFSFWSYGVNGLRNGLGTAFFILGLYFYNKKVAMYISFLLGYFMHASIIIPIAAFIVASLYKHPKIYLYIWIAAIPLSLIGGSAWTNLFSSLGFAEDRTEGYLVGGEQFQNQFSQTGFRWDFLLYSTTAVFAGWYFIFKKQITDQFYIHIFGIYCIANAFWILVITAAFSNRFAYLSWFLMPAVISYPMFRYKIWKDQYKTFAVILFAYFMFTYFMNVIKGK